MWRAQRWDAGTPGISSSPSNTLENRLRSRWETTKNYPVYFCAVDVCYREIIKPQAQLFTSFCPCSFIISSATSWTISHHQAMNVRCLLCSGVYIHYVQILSFCKTSEFELSSQTFQEIWSRTSSERTRCVGTQSGRGTSATRTSRCRGSTQDLTSPSLWRWSRQWVWWRHSGTRK